MNVRETLNNTSLHLVRDCGLEAVVEHGHPFSTMSFQLMNGKDVVLGISNDGSYDISVDGDIMYETKTAEGPSTMARRFYGVVLISQP